MRLLSIVVILTFAGAEVSLADSISISGSCTASGSDVANCSATDKDQYGDVLWTATANIAYGSGVVSGASGTYEELEGNVKTTLGDISAIHYFHPGVVITEPELSFTISLDFEGAQSLEIQGGYVLGQSDECPGCAPSLKIPGVAGPIGPGGKWTIENPGVLTIESDVSTIVDSSYDQLQFDLAITPIGSAAPEPRYSAVEMIPAALLYLLSRRAAGRRS